MNVHNVHYHYFDTNERGVYGILLGAEFMVDSFEKACKIERIKLAIVMCKTCSLRLCMSSKPRSYSSCVLSFLEFLSI